MKIFINSLLTGMLVACLTPHAHSYSIYVSNEKDNTISVIDGETLELVDTIEVGQRPRGIVLSNDGSLLYMCTSDDNHVEVMNVETKEILHTLPSGPDPELMALSPLPRTVVRYGCLPKLAEQWRSSIPIAKR